MLRTCERFDRANTRGMGILALVHDEKELIIYSEPFLKETFTYFLVFRTEKDTLSSIKMSKVHPQKVTPSYDKKTT